MSHDSTAWPSPAGAPGTARQRRQPVLGSAALADEPSGFLGHPAAHRHTRHPGRPGDHRTRPDRHPGRRRRAQSQRPGDGHRPDVPGRHLSAFHSPRYPRLPHLAVCTHAHQRQSALARITTTALADAMRSPSAYGPRVPRRSSFAGTGASSCAAPSSPCAACRSRRAVACGRACSESPMAWAGRRGQEMRTAWAQWCRRRMRPAGG